MREKGRLMALGAFALLAIARPLRAQGYSLHVDLQAQTYAFRGLKSDSVRSDSVITNPDGSLISPGGHPVICPGNSASYCDFFLAGPRIDAIPLVGQVDANLWGLGVPGLRLHASARVSGQAGDPDAVAGTTPAFQLMEGYAEYVRDWLSGRLGRQFVTGRLGYSGFDGGMIRAQSYHLGLGITGYVGRGLAQGTFVTPSNPIINPLDQWQPAKGMIVAGGSVDWTSPRVDSRFDYEREVDNDTHGFVAERIALTAMGRLTPRWGIEGGADYDLSYGEVNKADLTLRYSDPRFSASAGVRRYRPFFDLWTIWGAFSPTPYSAANAALTVEATSRLEVRGSIEYFWYGDTFTDAPLVTVQDDGWRSTVAAGYRFSPAWSADATFEVDRGPGAASNYLQGQVRWQARSDLKLGAHLGTVSRPLEFRYNSAGLFWTGVEGEYQAGSRVTLSLLADWLRDEQTEPDVGDFTWSQLRLSLKASWFLTSAADFERLPKALPRRPPPQ